MDNKNNIVVVKEFSGKYKINQNYRPIAEALKAKFTELQYVPVQSILFIENLEDKKKKNNKTMYAQISKVPNKWAEIIYQVTGRNYEYMLEIFKYNTAHMSREQMIALIYHELRHIQFVKEKLEVDIVGHDVEDWLNMVEKLGLNWPSTKAQVYDLLADNVNWETIEGPPSLIPAEMTLKLVK